MFDAASRYLLFPLKRAVADVLLPYLEMVSPPELCHWLILSDMYVLFIMNTPYSFFMAIKHSILYFGYADLFISLAAYFCSAIIMNSDLCSLFDISVHTCCQTYSSLTPLNSVMNCAMNQICTCLYI